MDHRDENCRRMEEIYDQLHSAYCQFNTSSSQTDCFSYAGDRERAQSLQIPEDMETGLHLSNSGTFAFLSEIKGMIDKLTMFFRQGNHPTRIIMASSSVV